MYKFQILDALVLVEPLGEGEGDAKETIKQEVALKPEAMRHHKKRRILSQWLTKRWTILPLNRK